MGRPVMIESAINGNALRELNPNIPYSPEEITSDAIATCRAGAALIHFHVRDPKTGRWVQDVPYYSEVYRRTRRVRSASVAYVSVRWNPCRAVQPLRCVG